MNKNKICQLTSVHPRYDVRIFKKVCHSLSTAGYNVYLLVADGKKNETIDSINIIDVGNYNNRIKRFVFTSQLLYKKALELNCDIYHFHDPELLPIAIKLKKRGKKVIFDSHEYLPAQIMSKSYIPKLFRSTISYMVKAYYNLFINRLDTIITVTPHIVEEFKKITDKVSLITNYPLINKKIERTQLNTYISKKNTVIYAGTIYRISQQDVILKAIENINNINYLLIGNININYKIELSKYPSWQKVSYIPYVQKTKLDQFINTSTIGLVIYDYTPNWGNKIGSLGVNKIFEYMLAGLPVICTDFILWQEIIDKYKCGICINPNSVEEISDAIKYLMNNKEDAYQMGQNGRTAVLKEFNWSTQEKKLLEIYKQLLK